MKRPKFTVLTNIVSQESSEWVGMSWEFFDTEDHAKSCAERHIKLGNVPTIRKYHRTDSIYMGAVHQEQPTIVSSSFGDC